jgi:hypothetical protein
MPRSWQESGRGRLTPCVTLGRVTKLRPERTSHRSRNTRTRKPRRDPWNLHALLAEEPAARWNDFGPPKGKYKATERGFKVNTRGDNPVNHCIYWSQRPDLNRGPTDYESVALPTELRWLRAGLPNDGEISTPSACGKVRWEFRIRGGTKINLEDTKTRGKHYFSLLLPWACSTTSRA